MPMPLWSETESRRIVERIVVEADLRLETPAHLGNGEPEDLTDMPLMLDSDGKTPLLTGSSIAGALRSYLRRRTSSSGLDCTLFGGAKRDDDGLQSLLIVDDARGNAASIELRNGVRLDPETRTAADKALYNFEAWAVGTVFKTRFELLVPDKSSHSSTALKELLVSALEGFSDGGIHIGSHKHRGLGRVSVKEWRIRQFHLTQPDGLLAWIRQGGDDLGTADRCTHAAAALNVKPLADRRRLFRIDGQFALKSAPGIYSSLLIRSSGTGEDDADMIHLSARSSGARVPVTSGTSIGGALRHRARMIAEFIHGEDGASLVRDVFGSEAGERKLHASRLEVEEYTVTDSRFDLVQNRVSIDRFTAGAREGALFNEQPAFGNERTRIRLVLTLRDPHEHEIGLLLLLLKDLWTSDLPLGGESSVGRGRLEGECATLTNTSGNGAGVEEWEIVEESTGFRVARGESKRLESFVGTHLRQWQRKEIASETR